MKYNDSLVAVATKDNKTYWLAQRHRITWRGFAKLSLLLWGTFINNVTKPWGFESGVQVNVI